MPMNRINSVEVNEITVVIPGRLPALNEYTNDNRSGVHAGAGLKKKTETALAWQLKSQLRNKAFGYVSLKFSWYEKDKRRDKDNVCFAKKFILDALQTVGAINGDGWKHIDGFEDCFYVDAINPRVEITICEVKS